MTTTQSRTLNDYVFVATKSISPVSALAELLGIDPERWREIEPY